MSTTRLTLNDRLARPARRLFKSDMAASILAAGLLLAAILAVFDVASLPSARESFSATEIPPVGTSRVVEDFWPGAHMKTRRHVIETPDGQQIPNGQLEVWYPSGRPRSRGTWQNGQKHGHFVFWHENGQKRVELDYVNGEVNGVVTFWDADGKEVRRETWANGKQLR